MDLTKRWIWVLVAIGAVAVIGYFLGGSGDGDAGGTTTAVSGATESTGTSRPGSTTTASGAIRWSLPEAVARGLVEVEFRALGGASGDVVEMDIQRFVGADLEITVPVGLMLQNPAGSEQDLVVAGLEGLVTGDGTYEPQESIHLDDELRHTYLLEAYCAEAHDANPSDGGALQMGAVADADLVAVLEAAVAKGVSGDMAVVQAVVWVVTDDVTGRDLEAIGYGLDEEDLATARAVVAAAGLDPDAYRLFDG